MSSITKLPTVEGSNGFANMPCDSKLSELGGLDNQRVSKYYARGSVLFTEGQRSRGIYILCQGRVKVSIASAEGKTLVLRIGHPGDLLGLNSVLTGKPHGATVQTLERCRIDFIAQQDLLRLLARDKKAYADVVQVLCRKLSTVIEHSRLIFLSQSASEKLARLLVMWCDEHGNRTSQGIRINSGLTHEEIAQMICSSRETVTRVLGEFRRRRIVSLVDNTIFVRSRKALEAAAGY